MWSGFVNWGQVGWEKLKDVKDVGLCEAGWISEVFRREARSGQIENN